MRTNQDPAARTASQHPWLERARGGDLAALDALLADIQHPVYQLAVRMLGHREDAQDATQEILLKITTHLSTFRGDSAFGTWVHRIAVNHLLTARMRAREFPAQDFEGFASRLAQGLAAGVWETGRAMQPDEKLEARRLALRCTQAMLLCLDRPHRLAYVLDAVLGMASPEAARVQGIGAAAHRKRLSRARAAMQGFMQAQCGLLNPHAACRCERQLPGLAAARAASRHGPPGLDVTADELSRADQALQELRQMSDAVAVLRGAPDYAPPVVALIAGIRQVLSGSAWLRQ